MYEPNLHHITQEPNEGKIQFDLGGKPVNFNELLAYSNIQVPSIVHTATSELLNHPTDTHINLFAYQPYDRPTQLVKKTEKKIDYENLTKEEASRIFKKLLSDLGVTATWHWEDAKRIVQNESRAKALKSIREQKQAFNEYIAEYKQREKEEIRQKKLHLKNQFIEMLEESHVVTSQTKYYDIARFFVNDPRFRALEDIERENIFQDYLDDLEKKDKEYQREITKQHINNLRNLFEEQKLSPDTTWEQCRELYSKHPIFKIADEYEQITAFTEYMKVAEKQDFDEKRRIRRYHERKNREAYRQMLEDKFRLEEFTIKTKWNKMMMILKDDPRYLNILGQPGSTPKELFDYFITTQKANFKRHKAILKQVIRNYNIKLTSKMTFEEFNNAFSVNTDYIAIKDENKKFLHEYVLAKVRQKEKDTVKKYMKAIKKYESFVRSIEGVNKNSKYEDYKELINQRENFNVIGEDEKRMKFYGYVLRMTQDSDSEESGIIEKPRKRRGEEDRSKRKRRKSSSSSSESNERRQEHLYHRNRNDDKCKVSYYDAKDRYGYHANNKLSYD